jgi:predicted TIM-barrel fold metal-dependent hydrolase
MGLSPVIPVVDAHQHFWKCGTYQTSWMEKLPACFRSGNTAPAKRVSPAKSETVYLFPSILSGGAKRQAGSLSYNPEYGALFLKI